MVESVDPPSRRFGAARGGEGTVDAAGDLAIGHGADHCQLKGVDG